MASLGDIASMADHTLHEPSASDVILIRRHQAVVLSLIPTDLSHSNTTLTLSKLHNAAQEISVRINFDEPEF
jgi:hypothetical protein